MPSRPPAVPRPKAVPLLPLGALGLLALVAFAPAASAVPTIDEQFTAGATWTPDRGFWQSVETEATRITKVDLFLQSPCNGAAPVRLKVTTSPDPNSGVLADVDGYAYTGSVGSGSWVSYDFADFPVAPYTDLYLHLLTTQMMGPWCAGGNAWWSYSNSGTYPFGQASWNAGADINFRVWGDYYEQSLTSGTQVSSTIVAAGDARYFSIAVPSGARSLSVQQGGSSGDFDLYVRHGARPTPSSYDCRPFTGSTAESCSFDSPAAGTWYIMTRGYSGSGSFTMKATYTVNQNPYTPTLSSPASGATGVSWTPTFSWSSSGDPDSGDTAAYTVYARPSGGSYASVCTATHPTTSCTWGGSPAARGAVHDWYVQASDGHGGTASSATRSFTTKPNTAPALATGLSPANGAVNRPSTLTLSWTNNGDPDGDSYTTTVLLDSSPTPSTVVCGPTAGMSSCSVSGLSRNVVYNWRVRTTDSYGDSSLTAPISFSAGRDPYVPALAAPANGATGVSLTPTLSWSSSGDPDGDTVTYTLKGAVSGGSDSTVCTVNHPTTSCAWAGRARGTTYTWYVQATDGVGTVTSATRSFTTAPNNPPNAATGPSPANGASGIGWAPTLSWTNNGDPDGDPVTYSLYLGTSPATATLRCGPSATLGSCSVTGLARNTLHYWTVRATDSLGATRDTTWQFTTKPNTAPAAGFTHTVSGLTVSFTSVSSDADGDALSYSWDFGDGGWSTAQNPTHAYACIGRYTVGLTVYDGHAGAGDHEEVEPVQTADGDGDGLVACREAEQGTSDGDADSDDDRLNDLVESQWYGDRDDTFCNDAGTNCFYPDPLVRDLYVEVDWYTGRPFLQGAVDAIEAAFGASPLAADVNVHIDIGAFGGGGTDLGAGGEVTMDAVRASRTANLEEGRRGIFHYVVNACRDPGDAGTGTVTYGVGETPGDDALLYDCRLADANRANDQAEEFMHEVGHNIMGARVVLPDCNARSNQRNPTLDHFDSAASRRDCNGDGAWDFWSHSTDPDDAMISGGPAAKNGPDYAADTWQDVKLDWGISGLVPDCVQVLNGAGLLGAAVPACDTEDLAAAGLAPGVDVPQTGSLEDWLAYMAGDDPSLRRDGHA